MRLSRMAIVTAALVAVLVLGLVGAGGFLLSRIIWSGPVQAQGPSMDWGVWGPSGGMMGNPGFGGAFGSDSWAPCWSNQDANDSPAEGALTLEQAQQAVVDYLQRTGYQGLEVDEVMEFERNFYAIVAEEATGIGAMELLIDKQSGAVGPEYGPNMMWNTRYGMHGSRGMGGMMRGYTPAEEMTVSPEEALADAQRWLDANRPGMTVEEHADPFYGYYTIHTWQDGAIGGMLSVHGATGQIWYHSWHGEFIDMIEEHSEEE